MKAIRKLLTIYSFTLIFTACENGGNDPQPITTGTISGSVSAALDQSPVARAEVIFGGQSVQTAADGTFKLSDVPAGSDWLRVEAGKELLSMPRMR
jgi:hypothetical protein